MTPDGDVNNGPTITIVSWTECGIALVLLLARIWTRVRILNSWGWDDAFMCLAMICAIANSGLLQVSIQNGTGRHLVYLSDHHSLLANKYNFISQGLHVMSTNWGKVSIAMFLLRMVDRAKQQRHYFYIGIALLTIVNGASVGIIYGQCEHVSDLWAHPTERKGSCWDPSIHTKVAFAQGSFSALSDLVLAVYPAFIIWNLNMVPRVKLIITFVMMLGILAMAAAIVKTIYLASLGVRGDFTYDSAMLSIWVVTEQYMIVIAACIPPLGPLFKMIVQHPSTRKSKSSRLRNDAAHGAYKHKDVGRHYNRGDAGQFNTLNSGHGTDFQGYPLAEYNVTTWTRTRPDDDSPDEDAGSGDGIVLNRTHSNDQGSHPQSGGIMKTLEVQVQSEVEIGRQHI